ncbi:MAG: DEAD/DEAH box helicase family protein [Thiomicrorhabdus sp.]|jgi:superfamily II DNA or RNA helicase|nr:DEAD/DEAH box helicase family protein [Thiomicrorhabdus sp.]
MSKITLTLLDEVNCHFGNLTEHQIETIIKKTKIADKSGFMSVAYKLGQWDGRTSYFGEDGFTFIYMIDQVLDILEDELRINIEKIKIIDERSDSKLPTLPLIDEKWLIKESGFNLREHQVEAINSGAQNKRGTINAATNAGKTLICLGISKLLDPHIKTVVIVPSAMLAQQTFDDYAKSDLSVLLLNPKIAVKKREEAIKSHRHVIVTTKLFINCVEHFKDDEWAMMYDEVHTYGDVIAEIMRFDIAHWENRLGLTGTFPKDKLKAQKINNHFNGGVLTKVSAKYMIDKGYSTKTSITLINTNHQEIEDIFDSMEAGMYDWSIEFDYMTSNVERIKAIADYIKSLDTKNTLILCHKALGVILDEYFEGKCIIDETPLKDRISAFDTFTDRDDYYQVATFGTSGTGISQNNMQRIVLIDVGKNETSILQGIGRGHRLDGKTNELEVIDICSNTKYAQRHKLARKTIYKRESFKYTDSDNFILVN